MESDGDKPNNEKKDEINYEQIQNEYNKLEEKNILYRLKRWEKNLILLKKENSRKKNYSFDYKNKEITIQNNTSINSYNTKYTIG